MTKTKLTDGYIIKAEQSTKLGNWDSYLLDDSNGRINVTPKARKAKFFISSAAAMDAAEKWRDHPVTRNGKIQMKIHIVEARRRI